MRVNTNIIIASSDFSGFKNYASASFTAAYAGGSLGAGTYVGPIQATTALNNANAVSEIKVKYVGLDTFYRYLPGSTVSEYPTAGTVQYEIQSLSYFTAGVLHVDSYIINETAGSVSVPAITFTCSARLYTAPF